MFFKENILNTYVNCDPNYLTKKIHLRKFYI